MSSSTQVPDSSPEKVKKKPWLSHRAKIILALVIIGIAVVLAFFAPPEGDSSNVTGDTLPTTVTVTSLLGSINVNKGVDYNNARITVTSVQQASKFSDDLKAAGSYTIRVQLSAQGEKGQQSAIGINFSTAASLQLADGQIIAPKLVNMSPSIVAGQTNSGYIDFPVSAPVSLTGLTLRLGNNTTLPFSS